MELKDILPFLVELNSIVDERVKKQTIMPYVDRYQSEDITELVKALSKAQGEFTPVKSNRKEAGFKSAYTDLTAIIEMAKPILTKNNLSLFVWKENTNGAPIFHTRLNHDSGQWIESRSKFIPASNDTAAAESKENNLKKMDIKSLLNITIYNDPLDDDGYSDTKAFRQIYGIESITKEHKEPDSNEETINQEQLEIIEKELLGYDEIRQDLCQSLNIKYLADIPLKNFKYIMKKLGEIKSSQKK
jgi:hypothetical protein